MDKLTMAHEYAVLLLKNGRMHPMELVETAWFFADSIQAEADKRKQEEDEKWRNELKLKAEAYMNCDTGVFGDDGEYRITTRQKEQDEKDWQPDWSQAPEWAKWWCFSKMHGAIWFSEKPDQVRDTWVILNGVKFGASFFDEAPSFNYQGDWRHSLRKRP